MKTQHHPKTGRLVLSACLLFATVCVSTSTAQIVYDDFSSNNLDKWNVVAVAGNTYSIASSILTLQPSASPNYGYSTYTSTKSDFLLTRSTGKIGAFFDMPANAFIRTVATGTYQEINFGIKDSSPIGNTLFARIGWNGNGQSYFDIWNNDTNLVRWFQGDITAIVTAGKRFALEWDGSTASVNLYNGAGIFEATYTEVALSAPSLGTSGSLFFEFNTPPNVPAGSGRISMDSIGVIPEPSTATLAATGLLGLLACARRRRK